MMKQWILVLLVVFSGQCAWAQFDTSFAKSNALKCADSLAYGFRTRNWETYARYTNPALIGSAGGKAAFIRDIAGTFSQIPDSAWKTYKTGKVLQVVKTPNDLQAIVELKSVLVWQGKKVTSTYHLVGQSWDGGLFWTFFDSQNDKETSRSIKPDLSDRLIIPARNEKFETLK